jgi:hypothetical protein
MSDLPIPAEAIDAAVRTRLGVTLRQMLPSQAEYERNITKEMLETAAPLIARAARIAEIRAIADWLDAEANRDFLDADQRPYAADRLRERADQMEARPS